MPDESPEPDRRLTFPRSHRLKRQQLIRSLFDRSRSDVRTVAVGCIRLLYRMVDRDTIGYDVPLQIGFSPGPRARSGVKRTRVRRLLRETYRVHQHRLTDCCRERDDALIAMVLFRGAPEKARTCISRDLPRALSRAAHDVARVHAA